MYVNFGSSVRFKVTKEAFFSPLRADTMVPKDNEIDIDGMAILVDLALFPRPE